MIDQKMEIHYGENYILKKWCFPLPIMISCEHASSDLPKNIQGVYPVNLLKSHWGCDLWVQDLLYKFSNQLMINTVCSRISRLFIDLNRSKDNPSLIPQFIGSQKIEANCNLSYAEVCNRIKRYYDPYHWICENELNNLTKKYGAQLCYFAFHSFTNNYNGQNRNFDIGVLFDDSGKEIGYITGKILKNYGLKVRMNEPYSGYKSEIFSAHKHGSRHGLNYFVIEINQSIIKLNNQRQQLSEIFIRFIPKILALYGSLSTTKLNNPPQ